MKIFLSFCAMNCTKGCNISQKYEWNSEKQNKKNGESIATQALYNEGEQQPKLQ